MQVIQKGQTCAERYIIDRQNKSVLDSPESL